MADASETKGTEGGQHSPGRSTTGVVCFYIAESISIGAAGVILHEQVKGTRGKIEDKNRCLWLQGEINIGMAYDIGFTIVARDDRGAFLPPMIDGDVEGAGEVKQRPSSQHVPPALSELCLSHVESVSSLLQQRSNENVRAAYGHARLKRRRERGIDTFLTDAPWSCLVGCAYFRLSPTTVSCSW